MSVIGINEFDVASYPFGFLLSYADVRKSEITKEFLFKLSESLQVHESGLKKIFSLRLDRMKALMAHKEKAARQLEQLSSEIEKINEKTVSLQSGRSKKEKAKICSSKNGTFSDIGRSSKSSTSDDQTEKPNIFKENLKTKELRLNEEMISLQFVCDQLESKIEVMKTAATELVKEHKDMESTLLNLDSQITIMKKEFGSKQQELESVSNQIDKINEETEEAILTNEISKLVNNNETSYSSNVLVKQIEDKSILLRSESQKEQDVISHDNIKKKKLDTESENVFNGVKMKTEENVYKLCKTQNEKVVSDVKKQKDNVFAAKRQQNFTKKTENSSENKRKRSNEECNLASINYYEELSLRQNSKETFLDNKLTDLSLNEKCMQNKIHELNNKVRELQELLALKEKQFSLLQESSKKHSAPYNRAQSSMALSITELSDLNQGGDSNDYNSKIFKDQENFFCKEGSILSGEKPVTGAVAPSCSRSLSVPHLFLLRANQQSLIPITDKKKQNVPTISEFGDILESNKKAETVTILETLYESEKEKVQELQTVIENLKQKEQACTSHKESLERTLERKEEEKECLEAQIRGIKLKIEWLQNNLLAKEELRKGLDLKYQHVCIDFKEVEKQQNQEVKKNNDLLEVINQKLFELQNDLNKKEKAVFLVQEKISEAENETKNLENRLTKALTSQESLREEIVQKESQLEKLQEAASTLNNPTEILEFEIGLATKKHNDLQKVLQEKKTLCELDNDNIKKKEEVIKEKGQLLNQLEEMEQSTQIKLQNYENIIKNNNKILANLVQTCDVHKASICQLKKETEKLQQEETEAKALLLEKQHVVEHLKKNLKLLEEKEETLSNELKTTQEELDSVNESVEEKRKKLLKSHELAQAAFSSISTAIEQIEAERQNLEARYNSVSETYNKQAQNLAANENMYRNDLEKKKKLIEQLTDDVRKLEVEENNLRMKLRWLKNKKKEHSSKLAQKNASFENHSKNYEWPKVSSVINSNDKSRILNTNNVSSGEYTHFRDEQKQVQHLMLLHKMAEERKLEITSSIEKTNAEIKQLETIIKRNEVKIDSLNELICKQQQKFADSSKTYRESLLKQSFSNQVKTLTTEETISDLSASANCNLPTEQYHDASTQTLPGVGKEKLLNIQQDEYLLKTAPRLLQTCKNLEILVEESRFEAPDNEPTCSEEVLEKEKATSLRSENHQEKLFQQCDEQKQNEIVFTTLQEKNKITLDEATENVKGTTTQTSPEISNELGRNLKVVMQENSDDHDGEKNNSNQEEATLYIKSKNFKTIGQENFEPIYFNFNKEKITENENKTSSSGLIQKTSNEQGLKKKSLELQEETKELTEMKEVSLKDKEGKNESSVQFKLENTIPNLVKEILLYKDELEKKIDDSKAKVNCFSKLMINSNNYSTFEQYVIDRFYQIIEKFFEPANTCFNNKVEKCQEKQKKKK